MLIAAWPGVRRAGLRRRSAALAPGQRRRRRRLDPEQTDLVLGDGARDRGAACELISTDPATGAGVAFVRTESDPDPVRVRAGWVSDTGIRDLAAQCVADTMPLELEGVPA